MGRTLKELQNTMDVSEFMEWLAFEMSQDKEFRDKWETEIKLEQSAKKTPEQRAEEIRRMFAEIGTL